MEYNPMDELGFIEDKQFFSSCHGIISTNNYARNLCDYMMKNGANFFDVVARYEDLTTYALGRDTKNTNPMMKMIVPFLRAAGVTDHIAYTFACNDLRVMPGAKECFQYIRGLMPMFITTSFFDHHVMKLSEAIDVPISVFGSSSVDFDSIGLDKQTARDLRSIASEISVLSAPKTRYTFEDGEVLSNKDAEIVERLDEIFLERLQKFDVYDELDAIMAISTNEKSYSLLEIRKRTEVELSNTIIVGSELNDHVALDLVRDSDGLSISFNATERAVRTSNVSVNCKSATPIAVLAAEFYDKGIESVYDMIENWDRKKLRQRPCADRNLMDRFLAEFPKKLPIVNIVTKKNQDEIAETSEAYRKKILSHSNRF